MYILPHFFICGNSVAYFSVSGCLQTFLFSASNGEWCLLSHVSVFHKVYFYPGNSHLGPHRFYLERWFSPSSDLLPSILPIYPPPSFALPLDFFIFSRISSIFLFSSNDPFCPLGCWDWEALESWASALPLRHTRSPCFYFCCCCFVLCWWQGLTL